MTRLKTLKPRLTILKTDRLKTVSSDPDSWRNGKTTAERGYGSRWRRAREAFLRRPENVLCVMCQAQGLVRVATVVDHKVPHRGDEAAFWDESNWQSLCATHHSSDKQRQEKSGRKRNVVGPDGWAS